MKFESRILTAAALLALATPSGFAGEAVGYNAIAVPGNSDVLLSVPFNRDYERELTVQSVTGNGFTVADALTAGAYAGGAYYVRMTGGTGEGLWSTVVGNDGSSLTLEQTGILAHVGAGDAFRVYRHHTLGSMFPAGMAGKSFKEGSQVLIYQNNTAAMTQNKSAAKVAAYSKAGGGWVGAGVGNDTVLVPETKFVLRNTSGDGLTMVTFGDVPDYTVALLAAAGGDLVIGSGYPLPVTLNSSGLAGEQRQVLFYDNADGNFNKSASQVAASVGGNWVGVGIDGSERIAPSESVTLRLPATEAATRISIRKPY